MLAKTQPRRRYDAELKSTVLSECAKPGASVAAVASAYGLDADAVHKWRYQARSRLSSASASRVDRSAGAHGGKFVELGLPSAPASVATDTNIRIEVRRGNGVLVVSWPIAASSQCAALLAQCLR